ncbi:MAG: hypothetical protein E6Q88_01975 [Lysobacteraceae bacterium]|nr:MAG: hypothetical protein E6Q88_01975 [Xanthomonadaceae bacterium]
MIIPRYWSEARLQHRDRKRQVTVRRFGWSDISEADAQAHAQSRVREAFDRILAGENLARYERRVAYNGADGVPIREEIVDRDGETVITRNAYGALCLNTPDVLFADIDFERPVGLRSILLAGLLVALTVAATMQGLLHWRPVPAAIIAVFAALTFSGALAKKLDGAFIAIRGGAEQIARRRIRAFLREKPEWRLRIYRTPAGLRLLAVHRRFDPNDPQVDACFGAWGVDALYARMCRHQQCFRARVSPKPWRIGMQRLRPPYSAAWRPEHAEMSSRRDWIERYEHQARDYASCRYVETLGEGKTDPQIEILQRWHDELCQAEQSLPLA